MVTIDCPTIWRLRTARLASCVMLLVLSARVVHAQQETAPAAPNAAAQAGEVLTSEQVANRLKEIAEATDLDEESKARITGIYRDALKALDEAAQAAADTTRLEREAAGAADELAEGRSALAAIDAPDVPPSPKRTTLSQLTQVLQQKQAELNEAKQALGEAEDRLKRRATQRIELPKLIAAARERLADVDRQLQTPPTAGEPPRLVVAQRTLLAARRQSIVRQIAALEAKLANFDATIDLLPVRRDLARRRVTLLEQEVGLWQTVAGQRRKLDVAEQSGLAQSAADRVPKPLRPLAEGNVALVERRNELDLAIQQTERELRQTSRLREHFTDQYQRVLAQVEAVGLSEAVGQLLRKQRQSLPSLSKLRANNHKLKRTIGDVHFELLKLEDRRSELADFEGEVAHSLDRIDRSALQLQDSELDYLVRDLLGSERDYRDALAGDLNTYFHKLISLQAEQEKLIDAVEEFGQFIDQHVLWISSAPVVSLDTLAQAGAAAAVVVRLPAWGTLGSQLWADARSHPLTHMLLVLGLGVLAYNRRRLRRRLHELGETAERATCQQFRPTHEALAATVFVALLWPGVLACIGWRLSAGDGDPWIKAVGTGLCVTAALFFAMELVRQACRPKGLVDAHFRMSNSAALTLRRHLRWLMLVGLPLVLGVATLEAEGDAAWSDSLGRLGFILVMLLVSLFFWRVLRPVGGLFSDVIAYNRGGLVDRLKGVWYPLAALTPVVLAALAALGYYFTARSLALRLAATLAILLGLQLFKSLALRWILVAHRRIAIEQARQRWAAAAAERAAAHESETASLPPVEEPQLDFSAISAQTHRLLRSFAFLAAAVGLWGIWVDVMPALVVLDHVELWHNTVEVPEVVTGPDGTPMLRPSERYVPVTLARLALALLVLTMTVIAAKNLPGLLEVILLQRLPMDAALRFAITTVSRYIIILIGLIVGLNMVGVGWGQIQWLVAAVSVGLGFGLQEIFANFVSGLIILFERPLRVGDIVTIGEVTGKVVQIRIRATVILDWDRKELVVPNKEFITGRLLNWTLSDQVNRVVINVGVAYDANPLVVRELMTEVAASHPLVLQDPAPLISFEAFGDSALAFVLRAYLPNLDNRLKVITELHTEILQKFRDHGIEIAFPQQDIHIRSIAQPLAALVPVTQGANGSNGKGGTP